MLIGAGEREREGGRKRKGREIEQRERERGINNYEVNNNHAIFSMSSTST